MPNLDIVDTTGYPRRVKPVFFVIETSYSAKDTLIEAVNNAMHTIMPDLIAFDCQNCDAAIKLGVLLYNNDCYWMSPHLEYIDTFQWNDLSAQGDANLGNALCELEKQLSRKAMLSSNYGCYAPTIIYIGHNYPSAEIWRTSLEKLNHNNWYKHASKFVFTTNKDANFEMLKALVGYSEAIFFTPNSEELSVAINTAVTLSSTNYGEISGSISFPQKNESSTYHPCISIANAIRDYLYDISPKNAGLQSNEAPYSSEELSGIEFGFTLPCLVSNSYGREKCKLLKTIRKAIADANNIPYEITECNSKGHCNGACPACDQEAQELSQLINSYVSAGKPVIIPSSETTLLDAYLPPKPIEEAWLEW